MMKLGRSSFSATLYFFALVFCEVSSGSIEGGPIDEHDISIALRGSSEPAEKEVRGLEISSVSHSAEDGNTSLGFLWKMWHTDGIKWEVRGKDWCVQCRGEQGCIPDSRIVTHHCNPNDSDQRWEFIEAGDDGRTVQINAKGTGLCLTRMVSRDYVLKPCDEKVRRQLFIGYSENGKFTLQPYKKQNRFLTMHHHPKHITEFDGELIYDQPRHKPEKTETLYWVAEYRKRVDQEDLSLKARGCTEAKKCGECQGDCDNDDQCKGNLKCWQRFDGQWRIKADRGWETPWSKVPGCSGMGTFGRDYCYDPSKL